jgi:hypothetical protein
MLEDDSDAVLLRAVIIARHASIMSPQFVVRWTFVDV